MNLQIVVYGLGPIGLEILKKCEEQLPGKVIGAVDIDPSKIGKDIGVLTGGKHRDVPVVSSIQQIEAQTELPLVAIHATSSHLPSVWPQIKELLSLGYHVVSTCEELSYPWTRYPELSKEIDAYAKEMNRGVIGTGVNPGFVMDTLTMTITSVVSEIYSIRVMRRVDVTKRRLPLQKKVGVGKSVEEFNQLAERDQIGHVGLEESLRLLAAGLHLDVRKVTNTIEPTITPKAVQLSSFSLQAGQVNGLHQTSIATTVNNQQIELDLIMATDMISEDRIEIKGDMNINLVIPEGIFGDSATASIIINMTKAMAAQQSFGLLTMKDMMFVRYTSA
ncbi:4-hydroxy-tetrahydrodipicolinate reductase [Seinonella peptonophila]|uniref:4-hydroxy-tetrahydrodipicolinate reductase n=1 Tax=Seinonella peptonophila TaxID=112248 RepID=A0A1M4TXF0_9BACL|nr:hypothetical protein [Seinonella peptonophila]SHE49102.1 4-hydroxy-tetrahydrodipicolinate reductase [Seinonella peptonophila]